MASPGLIQQRIENLDAARRALSDVLRAEGAGSVAALTVIGQQAVTEIRRRAPLLTGRLRRSYTYEVDRAARYVEVSSNVEYAPYQEFGTRHQDGTPHVRPALEALRPRIPELVAEGAARAARQAAARHGGGGGGALGRLGGLIARLGSV